MNPRSLGLLGKEESNYLPGDQNAKGQELPNQVLLMNAPGKFPDSSAGTVVTICPPAKINLELWTPAMT